MTGRGPCSAMRLSICERNYASPLYGWQTFFEECDDVDDETLYEMAVLLGVMMGVGSANSMLTVIAKNAQEAVAKKVARQSLTKTSWYPS